MIDYKTDHMSYQDSQEIISHEIMDRVLGERKNADFSQFSSDDVKRAIEKDSLSLDDFKALLSASALPFLEQMAAKSKELKERHFGKNIYFFTPIYIANYCDSQCVYCGFSKNNKIRRVKLSDEELKREFENIKKAGFDEILMLTGESWEHTPPDYIAAAVSEAKKLFSTVGIEIYPLNSSDYKMLHEAGADFVTIFQETYNPDKYAKLHLAGFKRIFPYRFNAQERALIGGMRGVAFAALLGLDEWRSDALATGLHAHLIQKKYPHAEISLSVPRLRPIINNHKIGPKDVGERELLQVICAYRLFLPFANITLSSRESAHFRDHAINLGVTKVSAGVSVAIGEHGGKEAGSEGDGQFEVNDARSLEQMRLAIEAAGLTAVASDTIFV